MYDISTFSMVLTLVQRFLASVKHTLCTLYSNVCGILPRLPRSLVREYVLEYSRRFSSMLLALRHPQLVFGPVNNSYLMRFLLPEKR